MKEVQQPLRLQPVFSKFFQVFEPKPICPKKITAKINQQLKKKNQPSKSVFIGKIQTTATFLTSTLSLFSDFSPTSITSTGPTTPFLFSINIFSTA
jgi:hypothetical protein